MEYKPQFAEIKTALAHLQKNPFHCVGDKPLGTGAFGSVVKAVSKNEGKSYAMKIVPLPKDTERQKYPERELKALITLGSSEQAGRNIIQYHSSWIINLSGVNHLFIQMELCSVNLWDFVFKNELGGPKIIQNDGPPRFYQQVFQQVLSGLSFIHAIRWVHRDIHTGNILIVNSSLKQISDIQIKIADFGLARQIEIYLDVSGFTIKHKLKKMTYFPQKGCFSAPELNTDTYDLKVDVYSAGIILYLISCYCENRNDWLEKVKDLTEGRVDEGLCFKDDKKLSGLIKNLIQKDASKRLSASDAKEYMFPENKRVTNTSATEFEFYARKETEKDLNLCILKKLTLSGMQTAITRGTCVPKRGTRVPKRRQILRQERMVNGESKRIKIENNEAVKNIIHYAGKQGEDVVVVVREEEAIATKNSAEPMTEY